MTYVFLGPTLAVADASEILAATYLPPVSLGDVYRLTERDPHSILIIDGYFEGVPAVWHKEILYALSRGINVYGASSMGALRAAELEPYGMIGVGTIFERYRDGIYVADDEVAVTHESAATGYRTVSEALVNVRFALELSVNRDLISSSTGQCILHHAKEMFYPDRCWPNILLRAAECGAVQDELRALRALLDEDQPDLKKSDAVAALTQVKAEAMTRLPESPLHVFEYTNSWRWLVTTESRVGVDDELAV